MRTFGLIGYPLAHSFSKRYFTQKFKYDRIPDCEYVNFECPNINDVASIKRNENIAGLNVTIPYKSAIIPYLNEMSDEVKELNACNCISVKNGKWIGHNTDIIGFEHSFLPFLKPHHQKALILGTGGASQAVEYVLNKHRIAAVKVSRSATEGQFSYEAITPQILQEYSIVINTTPLGMHPNVDAYPQLPYDAITKNHYFFDLIYNPPKTCFLQFAEEKGATVENGDRMLMIQAEESWEIWNKAD